MNTDLAIIKMAAVLHTHWTYGRAFNKEYNEGRRTAVLFLIENDRELRATVATHIRSMRESARSKK